MSVDISLNNRYEVVYSLECVRAMIQKLEDTRRERSQDLWNIVSAGGDSPTLRDKIRALQGSVATIICSFTTSMDWKVVPMAIVSVYDCLLRHCRSRTIGCGYV